ANIHMLRGDARSALPLLQRVYDRGGSLPRGYYILTGDAFLRLGRPNEARQAYERALQIHPDDPVARERLQALR
ncbi:MAG TPA: tetratricopeptide repeat protein, partial [Thermoanaerobaculia bacterium]|nr:tetratricopeptide repeat protein [Thermoanaerobaculia bacterium]